MGRILQGGVEGRGRVEDKKGGRRREEDKREGKIRSRGNGQDDKEMKGRKVGERRWHRE